MHYPISGVILADFTRDSCWSNELETNQCAFSSMTPKHLFLQNPQLPWLPSEKRKAQRENTEVRAIFAVFRIWIHTQYPWVSHIHVTLSGTMPVWTSETGKQFSLGSFLIWKKKKLELGGGENVSGLLTVSRTKSNKQKDTDPSSIFCNGFGFYQH